MPASRIFFYSCLCFSLGIFLNSFFSFSQVFMLFILILGLSFISVFWHKRRIVALGLCFIFLALGLWRYQITENKALNHDFKEYNDSTQTIELVGIVSEEPDLRQDHVKLTFKIKNIDGKLLVKTDLYPQYQYGDRIRIKGSLEEPGQFNGFNYQHYLMKDNIYSVSYYPELELMEKNKGNSFFAKIFSFKNKLRQVINQHFSPPQSSVLSAVILGDKKQISPLWQEKLNYSGLRHLTAVSGMHVAILSIILMSFLLGLGFWRSQAFYLTVILIVLFVVITGFQPSAVRASFMAGIILLAQHLGKMSNSLRALVFTAVLMLFHNPLLLKFDVGFQLSFLAMLGIICFMPFFRNLLKKLPDRLNLRQILSASLSAQIFTLPILIYNFGYFSVVGLITNILVVPFLPYIMGLGLAFVLLGLYSEFIGFIISLPLWILLRYLILIVDWFSGLSFSAYFIDLPWPLLITCYLILIIAAWQVKQKERLKLFF